MGEEEKEEAGRTQYSGPESLEFLASRAPILGDAKKFVSCDMRTKRDDVKRRGAREKEIIRRLVK